MKLLHIGLCVQPPPINGFQKAFIDILGAENYAEVSTGHSSLNSEAVRLFDAFKPDIVFMQIQAPDIISKSTVKHFALQGAKVINWTGDVRDRVPNWMLELAPYCTTSFSNMTDVRAVKARNFKAEYLEIGYDPEIYTPEGDKAFCPEVVFMANNYGNQFPLSNYRSQLVANLKGLDSRFGLYGNGWNNANGNINTSQREEARFYRGAKIGINCSHFSYERYSSDRLLRILGSGCFCLTHKYPGIEQDYTHGEHLVVFDNFVDLQHKLVYYLDNDEERNRIAKAGEDLVRNRNTFKHQVENILKIAE